MLSHARCRSSILVNSFANAYNLTNKQEEYEFIKNFSYKERQAVSKSQDRQAKTLEIYTDKICKFTDQLFSENKDFVIKIWPRMLNASPFCYNVESFVSDLEHCFRFSQYDNIILSQRDPVNAICSLSLAMVYGFNFLDKDRADYATKVKYKNVDIHKVELNDKNKSFLAEILVIDKIKQYFDKKQIRYTYVSFDDIPSYLETLPIPQTPITWHPPIDTQIDYSKAVCNYGELAMEVEDYKQSILSGLNSFTF